MLLERLESRTREMQDNAIEIRAETLPDLQKGQGHKYNHGHAVVVSGGPGKTGAARLAARGALRIGAGLVTLACPARAQDEIAAQVTSVMVDSIDGPSGLAEMLEDTRFNALCLGPGLGLTKSTADLVIAALRAQRPTVLDADALSRFVRAPEGLFDQLHKNVVLTPHGGEFARLFPDLADGLSDEFSARSAAVAEASMRAGCTVLLKGQETVIANPDGVLRVHKATGPRSAPWLATAGAGDVLTGFIVGLLARGYALDDAVAAATWLHVECAVRFGPGLIAEDLPDTLPGVLQGLIA